MKNKSNMATKLRSAATWERYQHEPQRPAGNCFMCEIEAMTVITEFIHWRLIENNYPYDAVAEVHHMLVPKAHASFDEGVSEAAKEELGLINAAFEEGGEYDCIMQNYPVGQSQPQHLHYHLLTWKRV